ncbi:MULTISPECIES: HTH-type transcriptional regulator HdfR [unclassified Motilimonas]|uniref:HTH-type transcriptional regulator HdfR n=1 Tax=Motilimonas TaxID=1914248 RepID=UPI001E644DE5|nr:MULTISPECIES: HTH-type transcriptional regulator HdfR [unclassified Motilimonas]MCE0558079.1 HTH-type transcriptional regulator HdfR [Motilimonas sp. E26]MDO6526084.1 HTH-type transcriptional regulator HdfR [Motilimonas sp. 1_MG-2023]
MDTELLKTFLEVGHTRHFGKAAENLYLTPSAVSFRIKQLEGLLGVELFSRHRNNIQITPAGERMRPYAEAMLNAWDRAQQDIALSENNALQLSIGAAPNLWDAFLQPYINLVYTSLPGLALRADVISPQLMSRQLLERSLDIAVLFDPPKVDDIKRELLQQVELVMVSSDMSCEPLVKNIKNYIKVDWGTAFNMQHAREFSDLPQPILHTSSVRIGLDFILQNGGAAFLPQALIQSYVEAGELVQIADAISLERSVYAAYLPDSDRIEQIQQVIKYFQNDQ